MIKGKVRIDLTAENILKLISEYDVFMQFMPTKNWKLNEACISPFSHDGKIETNPSFLIGNKNGYLSFVEFSLGLSGDCFAFVQKLHGCSYNEALRIVDKEMGLGISDTSKVGEYKKIVASYKQPEECKEKHYSMIQVITRKFTQEELSWWNEYHQDITDLRREHIYSIDKVFLNRKRFPIKNTELRFGYLYTSDSGQNYWKIYRPLSSKKSKWVPNNTPITMMDGKENIVNCDIAFVTKSRKDCLVIKKIFPCVCAVQNESVACFSLENVEFLKANSDKQVLGFDSDVPGVTASQQVTKLFDFGYCNVPRKHLPDINDFAEWARVKGLKEVENYFVEKGLYG